MFAHKSLLKWQIKKYRLMKKSEIIFQQNLIKALLIIAHKLNKFWKKNRSQYQYLHRHLC